MPARYTGNRALASELARQFASDIAQAGMVLEREAKRRTPVGETGNLRNGYHTDVEVRGTHVRAGVVNNVHYAPYVEFGTRHMRGRHMLALGTQATARWLTKRGFKVTYVSNK